MRGAAVRPVVLAAGGTGGHLFPAEALAAELLARGVRVALLTDKRSGAGTSDVFRHCEVYVLRGAGLAGRGARAVGAAAAIAAGTLQARQRLRALRPSVLCAFGGYPGVAPVLAARMAGVPVVLHEQNAVLGRANRALARWARMLALSFPGTKGADGFPSVVTGNPVRPAILALHGRPYVPPGDDGPIRLLVLGGSLGARVFSDVVPDAVAELAPRVRSRVEVVQQCRAEDLDRVREAHRAHGTRAELATFFPDVAERVATAHLVLARAGASTVAELAVAGRPALFVPLPGSIDDHQAANAAGLVSIPQRSLTPVRLAGALSCLGNDVELQSMAHTSAREGRPAATASLADLVMQQAERVPQENAT